VTTRTTTFATATVPASTPTTVYVQGTGNIGLVKYVTVTDPTGTSSTGVALTVINSGSGANVNLGVTNLSAGYGGTSWVFNGFFTMDAGDTLSVECDVDVGVWISGALLPLP